MYKKTVAIVGATGLVGEKLTEIMQSKLTDCDVRLFGNTQAGKRINFRNKRVTVEKTELLARADVDYAVFAATEETAKELIPSLAERGVICIDNSAYFRLKKDVPLIVPSVNGDKIGDARIIANPNCSTIQTVIAVNALKSLQPTKLTAATYQSVSGAGKAGLCDLTEKNGYGKLTAFKHPIYDNVIPQIGEVCKDGYTAEERKMLYESRKILDMPRLKVNCFCARVPVSAGHGVFVNLAFAEKVNIDEIRDLLKQAENIILLDSPEGHVYPMPMTMRNTKYVGVGRICKDRTANAVNMFVVADNLLRGAAYNAYEILECVIRRSNA